MKNLYLYFIGTSFLLLVSCNVLKTTHSKPILNVKELAQLAPSDIFSETTEGISLAEKNILLNQGQSENWKIAEEQKNAIVVQAKNPFSQVSLFRVLTTNREPILITFTENEQAQNINSLIYKNKQFENIKVIPKVKTSDFFNDTSSKNIANKFPNAIRYALNTTYTSFDVSLSTWQNEELTRLKADYKISLKWNGNLFEMNRAKVIK